MTSCGGKPKTRNWRAKFLLRTALFESLREAEQIA